MRLFKIVLGLFLAGSAALPAFPGSDKEAVAAIRAQFVMLGSLLDQREAGQITSLPGQKRDADNEIQYQLWQKPTEILLEAIDEAIYTGTKAERTGALDTYWMLVTLKRAQTNWAYHPVLLDLFAHDDLRSKPYTARLIMALQLYKSRETALAFMAAADRVTDKKTRNNYYHLTAGLLLIDLPTDSSKPLEEEKMLSDFHDWFERNKDRIRFDKKGRFRLAGGEAPNGKAVLDREDRNRIRQSAGCVVRLMDNLMDGREEGAKELSGKCGEALLGAEGADLMEKAIAAPLNGAAPDMDLQAAIASSQGKYPIFDAALLASVYVVAFEKDPVLLKLAKDTADGLGPVEIERVVKGEPREVQKAAKELVKGMLSSGGE